ncbi:hypothetical protein [Nonlabens ponticola]|uniref:Uncharacterized protein n=1 Tax=Nonlabens ponticola TaxID=2496866 RepID=A0A3S9MZ49_9FLAO|nr:hypothetical protein [Nonlabens ponticola]AZQ44428.1 hypothetical protein EJ995_09300 [Nonlabens ponticola]
MALLASCSVIKSDADEVDKIRKNQDFTVITPEGWTPFVDHHYLSYTPHKTGKLFRTYVSVEKLPLEDVYTTLDDYVDYWIKYRKTDEVKKAISSDFDNAIQTSTERIDYDGQKRRSMNIYFEYDNYYYQFVYSSVDEDYDQYFEPAMQIYDSISFK